MATPFANYSADLSSLRAQAVAQGDGAVLSAVTNDSEELQLLYDRLLKQLDQLDSEEVFQQLDSLVDCDLQENTIDVMDENIRLRDENARLNHLIDQFEAEKQTATMECAEQECESQETRPATPQKRVGHLPPTLSHRGHESSAVQPAAKPVATPVQMTPREISAGALTWEQRKALVIEQLENDSFDAEEFLTSLNAKPPIAPQSQVEVVEEPVKNPYRTKPRTEYVDATDPMPNVDGRSPLEQAVAYVKALHREMEQVRDSDFQKGKRISQYEEHIAELERSVESLEQQLKSAAVGARETGEQALPSDSPSAMTTAANGILDSDGLVKQERERLGRLQEALDQKLRDIEISSSLQRAKLSRRCRELEHQNHDLEAQLEALERSAESEKGEGVGTKWMAKLGLVSRKDDG